MLFSSKQLKQEFFFIIFEQALSWIVGCIFATGLCFSGMLKRNKILGFLNLNAKTWDPSLLFVLATAVGVNIILFGLAKLIHKKPIFEKEFPPTNAPIDKKLIIGGILFGIGWGLGGICPGPVMSLLFVVVTPHLSLVWSFAFIIG